MNRVAGFFMMFVVAALMAVPVSAQDSVEKPKTESVEAEVAAARAAAEATSIASTIAANKQEFKIYELKHRTAKSIVNLLPPRVEIYPNMEFNTISVTASSEMHESIASILEKYDVPNVPTKTIQFQFFMVKASNSDNAARSIADLKKAGLPEKALTALNEVAGLTRYKGFELIDAPTLLAREGNDAGLSGQIANGQYSLGLSRIEVIGGDSIFYEDKIRIANFVANFDIRQSSQPAGSLGGPRYNRIGINTTLEFSSDEPVVIGGIAGNDGVSDISVITIVTATIK